VTNDTPMPPSLYPTLSARQLVPPTQAATAFPDIPGFPFHEGPVNPLISYDFGPRFDDTDQSGIITIQPPRIKQVLPTYVPKVNVDGNEVGGVPSVLHQAPLGTYTGWNLVATPTPGAPFPGQICVNTGAFYPFKETMAQRTAAGDPRASLEERYGTHAGYVCTVTTAAKHSVRQRFLRASAATALIEQARAGNVLTDISPTPADRKRADNLCALAPSP
jgi:hypothetical protein